MKLVTDAKKAWTWFSVQAMALVALIPVIWMQLPPETQALIPAGWKPYVITAVAVAGILGRLVDQGSEKLS